MQRWFQQDGIVMRALGTLANLVWINLLWVLFSLPLVTIGASLSAMYSCMSRSNRSEAAGFRAFLQSFRASFRRKTPLWLLVLFIAAFLLWDFRVTLVHDWPFRSILLIGLSAVSLFAAIPLPFLFFPAQQGGIKAILHRSFLLGVRYLPRTIIVLILWSIPLLWFIISPYTFLHLAWLWLGFGFALIAFGSEKLLRSCIS